MQASSYINFKLTGKRTIDIDQAARTQCLDISTMDWASEIGDVIGVDLDSVMPPLKLVNEIIGFVTDEAADATGLVSGIPVIAGCSDAMASMYAMGMSRLGEAGESSGTSSLVFVGSDVKSAPDLPVVTKPCAITGMPWVFDAPITTTGLALNWYIETMAAEERAAAKEQGKDIPERAGPGSRSWLRRSVVLSLSHGGAGANLEGLCQEYVYRHVHFHHARGDGAVCI